MSYQSILVHADQGPHAAARLQLAIDTALLCDAHLTASAFTGISRFAELDTQRLQLPQVGAWRAEAEASLAAFGELARRAGLTRYEQLLLDDDPEDGMLLQAPYHDLLVLSQRAADPAPPGVIRDLPASLLLHSGRPLLLAPAAPASTPFHHPLLAWDGSRAAARAFSCALPLLKRSDRVTLLVLNGEHSLKHGMEPGSDMGLFLARHGVQVAVVREFTRVEIGEALLAVAAAMGNDLLVMGGYGHQRLREVALGGTTRTVLRDMQIPVLMAH